MPSNKDLIKSITEEAIVKKVAVPNTKNKSNVQLLGILKELKAPTAPVTPPIAPVVDETPSVVDETPSVVDETPSVVDETPSVVDETPSVVDETEEKPSYPYSIAEGKALTCKKGILDEGKEIKAEYVEGGQETLDLLVRKGYVIKK